MRLGRAPTPCGLYPDDQKRRAWGQYAQRKYSCDVEDVARLLLAQGLKCPICDVALTCGRVTANPYYPIADDNWSIDHDHTTGLVRGVLCHFCNWNTVASIERIGIERLRRVVEYLDISIA